MLLVNTEKGTIFTKYYIYFPKRSCVVKAYVSITKYIIVILVCVCIHIHTQYKFNIIYETVNRAKLCKCLHFIVEDTINIV